MKYNVVLSFMISFTVLYAQKQMVDSDFRVSIENPAFLNDGPTVAIDEAHSNFHTADGQYKPFADLLTADGYEVISWTTSFEVETLKKIDILVIANARNLNALKSGSAFTEEESEVLREWVYNGGSLLLIADHAPFGHAADSLGKKFGISMGKGWVFDLTGNGKFTTQLEFSHENNLLGDHVILQGRDSTEQVNIIKSFTGQSIDASSNEIFLMKLSETAREAATTDDLNTEYTSLNTSQFGNHSVSVANKSQGIAMIYGKGRLVILGEAGMFSAQIIQYPDGREVKFGLNVPGYDNLQFALNIMHWLSGLLD